MYKGGRLSDQKLTAKKREQYNAKQQSSKLTARRDAR
jgi:hypothetical protein